MEISDLLPAAATAQLDRAIADAETAFADAGDVLDRHAVQYVLTIAATIVRISCETAHTDRWPARQLRSFVDIGLVHLVKRAYTRKHSRRITLDAFTALVHRELDATPWWPQFQDAVPERAADEPSPLRLVQPAEE
jgi:hypothetical protein